MAYVDQWQIPTRYHLGPWRTVNEDHPLKDERMQQCFLIPLRCSTYPPGGAGVKEAQKVTAIRLVWPFNSQLAHYSWTCSLWTPHRTVLCDELQLEVGEHEYIICVSVQLAKWLAPTYANIKPTRWLTVTLAWLTGSMLVSRQNGRRGHRHHIL